MTQLNVNRWRTGLFEYVTNPGKGTEPSTSSRTGVSVYRIALSVLALLLISCSGGESQPETLAGTVDLLIEEESYDEALALLQDEDPNDPEVRLLKEKTHLNYGLYSMSTFDEGEMRTRMNEALRQFVEVIRLNPDNSVARNQIEQIMSVYDSIPNREPEEDVLESLRSVGYDY